MPSAYVAVSPVVFYAADLEKSDSLLHYIRELLGNRESEPYWRALALVTILLLYFTLYLVLNAYIIY